MTSQINILIRREPGSLLLYTERGNVVRKLLITARAIQINLYYLSDKIQIGWGNEF